MTTSDMVRELYWLALLRAEATRLGQDTVGALIGYSRTTVSLVLSGKYLGSTSRVEAAVMARLQKTLTCPHLGVELTTSACREYADAKAPTHNPLRMTHWRACQRCQMNCKNTVKGA